MTMIILGIDTSCDETSMALLEIKNWKLKILRNIVSSQVKLHAKYGGVYPFLAKREHQRNLPLVFKKVIKGLRVSEINLVAVTVGPGLEPCLWSGINFAKDLAKKLKRPLIPVNHIEAHIMANFLEEEFESLRFKIKDYFPAICLVVSGGHTQLIFMKDIGKYRLIGETRDDAAGECFDKVARILGLGYPGGPAIAIKAAKSKTDKGSFPVCLPRPMIYTKDYDFSFSGLKTAVLYDFRERSPKMRKSKKYIQEMSREVQQAIIDVLIRKTIKAAKDFKVKSIILGGGVASNDELRRQFQLTINSQLSNVKFFSPPKNLCTDNGAMVALTAFFYKKEATRYLEKIRANANLMI